MSILNTNYDRSKIFIGNNFYVSGSYTNSTGSEITLAAGQLMGRIFATNKVDKCLSSNTNGSQVPLGILKEAVTVANGATATVSICIAGMVNKDKVTLTGVDAWTTSISLTDSATNTVAIGTLEDLLRKAGILPIDATELTANNNQ